MRICLTPSFFFLEIKSRKGGTRKVILERIKTSHTRVQQKTTISGVKKSQRVKTESSWRILSFNQTIINHVELLINHTLECLHVSSLSV